MQHRFLCVRKFQESNVHLSVHSSLIRLSFSPPTTMLFDRRHCRRCDYFRKIATAFFLTLRILTPFVYTYSYRQSYTDSRSKPSKAHITRSYVVVSQKGSLLRFLQLFVYLSSSVENYEQRCSSHASKKASKSIVAGLNERKAMHLQMRICRVTCVRINNVQCNCI